MNDHRSVSELGGVISLILCRRINPLLDLHVVLMLCSWARHFIVPLSTLDSGVHSQTSLIHTPKGQNWASVLLRWLYYRGRDHINSGFAATKWTDHNICVCIMEVSAGRGSTVIGYWQTVRATWQLLGDNLLWTDRAVNIFIITMKTKD